MKCSRPFLTLIIALSVLLTGVVPRLSASGMVSVTGLKRVEIDGDVIRLGEIAQIKGQDRDLIRKLKGVVIGRAQLPGKMRRIDEDYIKLRLKQDNIDLARIYLKIPAKIEVLRSFVEIPRQEIKRVVSDFIYEKCPWERDKVRIRNIRMNADVILPKGKIVYGVEPLKNTNFRGTIPLPVYFKVNGRFQKRIMVTADIEVSGRVVVTKRPLRRHQRITEDHVEVQERDMAKLPSNVVLDLEEVLGRRTKRAIHANRVLRPDLIEFPPLVKRGDVVLVVAESNGLRATALGVVREREGRRGERIRVENVDSKKSLYARVLDSKTVQVDF